MAIKLTILLHSLEVLFCRALLFCLGIPMPPLRPVTSAQRQLLLERLEALVPYVPTTNPHSLGQRIWLHIRGLVLVVCDIPTMQRRKLANNDTDFSPEITQQLENFPPYFRKNYHHQTDGYFSYESARRYDVQYELIFMGVGQRIRHVAASQLRRYLPPTKPYTMLECGSGTGNLGALVQGLYPDSTILVTDPSLPYLRFAKEKYPQLTTREVPTFMEDLSFVDSASLDVVFSGFIFHEIPVAQTPTALSETYRVLKSGGYMLILDSSQDHDGAENAFALDQFAETFHEPYYPEFRQSSLEEESRKVGFEILHHQMVFFSKIFIARKN